MGCPGAKINLAAVSVKRSIFGYLDRKLELVVQLADKKSVTQCLTSLHDTHNGCVDLQQNTRIKNCGLSCLAPRVTKMKRLIKFIPGLTNRGFTKN